MLNEFKEKVWHANLELMKRNLVILTWGNVSGFDFNSKLVVIKPSGIPYNALTPDKMVVVDLDGKVVEGDLNPSCDTLTHLELYKKYPTLKGITHTHSTFATAFAQAGQPILPYGTTHADYFRNEILCTRQLTQEEVQNNYEKNTGKIILEALSHDDLSEHRGILVHGHGVFAWGNSPIDAVDNAQVIEQIAKMAFLTRQINLKIVPLENYILDKHYTRKHGVKSYYGQRKLKKEGII